MRRFSLYIALLVIFSGIFGLASSVSADSIGDVRVFHTDAAYDAVGALDVSATERATGQNAYFYVDDRYWASLSPNQQNTFNTDLNQLLNEFDSKIYPISTALWGSEPKPGVDGDPRLTIFIENMTAGSGGYFKTINEYPISIAAGSNAREMIYVNAASVLNGSARDYLAHEFQHLISFNQKELLQGVSDDVWLNEARSEFNTTAVGYDDVFSGSTLNRREATFLRNSSDSLVDWPNTPTDYGIASMFIHYVADRFSPTVLADTIRSRDAGTVALNSAFKNRGVTEDFSGVFTDWMVASYLNDPTPGAQYQYARPSLQGIHVSPQVQNYLNSSGTTTSISLKEWQPTWIEYDFAPNPTIPDVVVKATGQSGYWSGAVIGNYTDGHHKVVILDGAGQAGMPTTENNSNLTAVVLAYTQGPILAVDTRAIASLTSTINVSFGNAPTPTLSTPTPTVQPSSSTLQDGDLMRRPGQDEIYVIWGKYRRYLTTSTLALYGFQNRPVTTVSDTTFFSYQSSNYIRAIDQQKVYAVWPDGTKHWLNITPTQWDASGRDWGAIFIVNDAEVNSYATGPAITQ